MNLDQKHYIPALFLHIQKTAGSSVVHAASRHYAGSLISHGGCWGRSPDSLKDICFISGHIGYDFCRSLIPGRFSFTFLRDPVERVVSMYYFCRVQDPSLFIIYERANTLDLKEFLGEAFSDPWIKKNIWNNQVWQLAHGYAHLDNRTISDFHGEELLDLAKKHLEEMSYVGFTETFSKDCQAIFSHLRMPLTDAIPMANVNHTRPLLQNLTEKDIDAIRNLTVLDQELYNYAKDKFARIASICP